MWATTEYSAKVHSNSIFDSIKRLYPQQLPFKISQSVSVDIVHNLRFLVSLPPGNQSMLVPTFKYISILLSRPAEPEVPSQWWDQAFRGRHVVGDTPSPCARGKTEHVSGGIKS